MKFSQRLYEAALPIWRGYHTHPFVAGIGDGSLPPEKFCYFMVQDYLYLYEYAKVFALGVVKTHDPALMRAFAQSVGQVLDGEMALHRAYMRRLGIDEAAAERTAPALANSAYTGYMLSVGLTDGAAGIMAAILACSWSYAEIGLRLAQKPGALAHPLYGEWVAGYCSDEYQAENRRLIDRIDALAEDCTDTERARLVEIFVACSWHEARFWDMAWNMGDC